MRYPVAIEVGDDTTAYGVVVYDIPGCFSAGDSLHEAMLNLEEAAVAWVEAALDAGQDIPAPSPFTKVYADPAYVGWSFADLIIGGGGVG